MEVIGETTTIDCGEGGQGRQSVRGIATDALEDADGERRVATVTEPLRHRLRGSIPMRRDGIAVDDAVRRVRVCCFSEQVIQLGHR